VYSIDMGRGNSREGGCTLSSARLSASSASSRASDASSASSLASSSCCSSSFSTSAARSSAEETRRVRLVRGEGRGVSTQYERGAFSGDLPPAPSPLPCPPSAPTPWSGVPSPEARQMRLMANSRKSQSEKLVASGGRETWSAARTTMLSCSSPPTCLILRPKRLEWA
jgi:hypothetical protein